MYFLTDIILKLLINNYFKRKRMWNEITTYLIVLFILSFCTFSFYFISFIFFTYSQLLEVCLQQVWMKKQYKLQKSDVTSLSRETSGAWWKLLPTVLKISSPSEHQNSKQAVCLQKYFLNICHQHLGEGSGLLYDNLTCSIIW